MHPNSRLLFEKYGRDAFRDGMRILEIGPDGDPSSYRKLVNADNLTWETLELEPGPGITHVATGEYAFPLDDNTFDLVLSGQVIEHVRKIWLWMEELVRVTKPGGTVVTVNPVSWPYHEHPVDCWRIFPEGAKALYDHAGLDVTLCKSESLEPKRSRYRIPGASHGWQHKNDGTLKAAARSAFQKLAPGYPTTYAIDTITIGTKRA